MQNDEQAIRQMIGDWMRASKAGDTGTVLNLMTDDVLFLTPGRAPMTKTDFADAQSWHESFDMEGSSDIKEIKVIGEWAYIWTQLTVTMMPKSGGASVKREGHTLSVLRKENGQWRIARDANMLTVSP